MFPCTSSLHPRIFYPDSTYKINCIMCAFKLNSTSKPKCKSAGTIKLCVFSPYLIWTYMYRQCMCVSIHLYLYLTCSCAYVQYVHCNESELFEDCFFGEIVRSVWRCIVQCIYLLCLYLVTNVNSEWATCVCRWASVWSESGSGVLLVYQWCWKYL